MDLAGVLGEQLEVEVASTNLEEMMPDINAIPTAPLKTLRVQLKNGKATFTGTVSGKLAYPQVAGAVAVTNFAYEGIVYDRFSGQVSLSPSSASLQNGVLTRGAARALILGTAGLTDWKPEPTSPVSATVAASGAEITEVLNLAGESTIPIRCRLSASARVSGTLGNPRAIADVTVTKGRASRQPFDRLKARVDFTAQGIKVSAAKRTMGPAQITA